jgi:putative FmdB family regulatory protein
MVECQCDSREGSPTVPTYQYACTACDHHFETVQSFTDSALTECPECSGRLRKLFGSVGIVFKGSGFYRTDSRSGGSEKNSGSGEKSAEKKDSASGGESGGSKSEAKGSSGSGSGSSNSSSSSGSKTASSSAAS